MRLRPLGALLALCLLATALPAAAQIQLSAQTQRSNFLLYERVDLIITVVNIGETDLLLDNNEGHPWLSFLVTRHNHMPVKSERQSNFKALTLKTGETKTLRVNITPLFSFRDTGDYKASAVIDLPGQGQIVSEGVPFNIVEGRKVWSQTHPAEGSQRIYSLIRFSPSPDSTQLYLQVEDPDRNIVYTNFSIGEVASYIDPEVFFDPKGSLHILQPIALGTYLYTRTDPAGTIVDQRIFKTLQKVPPRLAKLEDGNVIVAGGQESNPNTAREKLSDGQSGQSSPNAAPISVPAAPRTTAEAPKASPSSPMDQLQ